MANPLAKPFSHLEKLKAGNQRYLQQQKLEAKNDHHSQHRQDEMTYRAPWQDTVDKARAQADLGTPPSYEELISAMLRDAQRDMGVLED